MKYPEDYINKIICGDCLEVMKGIPDNSVDLVLTDPPYGMNVAIWDKKPRYDFMEEIKRIGKDDCSIYVFCGDNSYIVARTEIEKYFKFENTIIWEKENFHGGGKYLKNHEYILFSSTGNPVFNRTRKLTAHIKNTNKILGKDNSVWKSKGFNNSCKEYAGHPTQKPLQIINRIILNSSNKNDIVFDPFLGSGKTAVSCKELEKRCIGIEKEPKYCDIANRRLSQEYLF